MSFGSVLGSAVTIGVAGKVLKNAGKINKKKRKKRMKGGRK